MTMTVTSRHGVPIRLTDERWLHIVEEHSELAGLLESVLDAIESADAVYEGTAGEKLASRLLEADKHLVVVYREVAKDDGFVITAFVTRRVYYLEKRRRLWP
jgi:hypothetical protein